MSFALQLRAAFKVATLEPSASGAARKMIGSTGSPYQEWEVEQCGRCNLWSVISCNGPAHRVTPLVQSCACPSVGV